MNTVQQIVEDLTINHDAVVTFTKSPKFIVFVNGVEYVIKDQESLVNFYNSFKEVFKYSK